MSHNIATLKAQYYPTDKAICNFFNFIHYPIQHEDEFNAKTYMFGELAISAKERINNYMDMQKTTKEFKYKKDWFKIPSYTSYYFQKDIIENDEKNIEKYKMKSQYTSDYYNVISNVDLFCGKGEWLTNYRKYLTKNNMYYISTLGVELVKERYDNCVNNKVDYCYNCAYEDFSISKNIISLLYFNPPYSTINGERLTKIYLQDIINKEYLIPHGSFVDFVIRIDDFKDCIDLLLDHFSIIEDTMFTAPHDEYDKFKQIVFTAKYKSHKKPILDTRFLIEGRQDIKENLLQKLDTLKSINVSKILSETLQECRLLPCVQLTKVMKSLQLKNNNKNKISERNDMVWNWFKDLTQIDTNTIGNLIIPKKLKQGEIINIISSGILNRKIDNHVVVGGTQQVTETTTSIKIDTGGKEHERIEVKKVNVPYFNILLPNGEIKKLLNKTEIESEE